MLLPLRKLPWELVGVTLWWLTVFVPPSVGAFSLPKRRRTKWPPPFSCRLQVAPQQLGSFEELVLEEDSIQDRKVLWEDWTAARTRIAASDSSKQQHVHFTDAWNVQKDYLQQHLDRLSSSSCSSFLPQDNFTNALGIDRIIALEHAPVYTLGTASDASLILNDKTDIDIIRMDRGGEVTYHGPGQLTVYPILDLRSYKQDIHWYVRALEECVLVAIEACLAQHGGTAQPRRDDNFTGVWVPNKGKIAAVGVKCRRWVTQHGVAINVESNSLPPFAGIVPCGLTGEKAQVTCINDLLEEPITVSQMAQYMKVGLEQVFGVALVQR